MNNSNQHNKNKFLFKGAVVLTLASLLCSPFLIFGLAPDTDACSKQEPKCDPTPVLITNYTVSKTVRNMSAGQSTYADLVNAEIGDRVVFKIVVANTGQTTLSGLEVSDDLPGELSYINSSLWTDASVAVSGANFFGPGLALGNLTPGQSVVLTFDADVTSGANKTVTNTIVAWGQEAEEKSDSARVYIINHPDNFNLSIIKGIRNLTSGQGGYLESVNAQNNDRVMFQIEVGNNGNATINNVFVRDTLPSYISYVSGTTRVDGNYASDGLVSGGINVGSLNVGATKKITFETTINNWGLSDSRTLTNYAYARADQVDERSDTASVYISASTGSLTIDKTVRNLTSSGSSGYFESVNASNNDRLSFQIQLRNNGNATINNVFVRDNLPSQLSYVSGSTRLNNSYLSDGIVSGGINAGSLNAGGVKNLTFEVTVNSSNDNYYNSQTLTNYAYGRADQINEISDTALVYLNQQQNGYINLYKYVRNLTAGQSSLTSSTNAKPGERVLFSIQLTAPTNQVYNARVWDSLPSGLNYVSGTTRVDNAYYSDNLFSGGINLGTLSNNQTKNITFEATVASNISNQTLINYAYASGNGISQRQATAQVIVGQNIATTSTLTKRVANLSWPNGTDADNQAYVDNTLQYTISHTNTTNTTLYNAKIADVLPAHTALVSTANNGYYDASKNQITWSLGTLNPNASASISYQAKVTSVPQGGFVIANSALLTADNTSIISNEVRTTVIVPVVKGETVKVITGGNDLTRNIGISLIVALWTIVALYFLIEYGNAWRGLRLKLALYKIRFMGNLS